MKYPDPAGAAPVPAPGALVIRAVVPQSADLADCQAMRADDDLAVWGNLDRCMTDAEALEYWRGSPYEERLLYVARIGGQAVGLCSVTLPLRDNAGTAGIDVLVASPWRRRGIGRALLAHAEAVAHRRGRTSLDAFHEIPLAAVPDGARMLPAESGAGHLPLDHPASAFAVASGYRLEQVERSSRLELPVPGTLLARVEAESSAHAGDYTLVTWDDHCPEDLVTGYALLKVRMSTDAPTAGMDWDREDWDAARVRDEESRQVRSGVQASVAAALHRSTGELVAYTVLAWRPEVPGTLLQQDTLVAAAHRGHRLGLLVKAANLRRAREKWPPARSVLTWNASENQHMLAINTALGFKPAGYEGEWQKRLG